MELLEDLSAYQKIKYYIKIYLNSQCYGILVTQATKRTTQRRLSKLVENKIMRIEGRGPSTTYKLIN